MSILSSILPGLRDLRTPLAAGCLWLVTALIIAIPRFDAIVPRNHQTEAISRAISASPSSIIFPTLIGAAFVIGNAAIGLTGPVVRLFGRVTRKPIDVLMRARYRTSLLGRLIRLTHTSSFIQWIESSARPVPLEARAMIFDTTLTALANAKIPTRPAMLFPIEAVIKVLPYSAAQLSHTASPQYQEYDRLKSEADFRLAIAPPLVALACVLPVNQKILVVAAAVLCSIMLLIQALSQSRAATQILASAVYLNHVPTPLVQGVLDHVANLDPMPENDGEWAAAIMVGLENRGNFEEAEEVAWEAMDWGAEMIEQAYSYLLNHDAALAEDAFRRYIRTGKDPDLIPLAEKFGIERESTPRTDSSASDDDTAPIASLE